MLKLSIKNQDYASIDEITRLTDLSIKSKGFYPGFNTWFIEKFIPGMGIDRDIIACRDKKYGTIVGFALLKVGEENKLCNLSPLIDGVGVTQTLLDVSHLFFCGDYSIDAPLLRGTEALHLKLKSLGFEIVSENYSREYTPQVTYMKVKNIGWI